MDVTCPYLHGAAPRTAALWGHRGQHTPQPLSWLAAAKLEVNLTGAPLKTPGHQVPPGGSPPAPAKPPNTSAVSARTTQPMCADVLCHSMASAGQRSICATL